MSLYTLWIRKLTEDRRYRAEERAAIHEFDGRLSREDAENRTMTDAVAVSVAGPQPEAKSPQMEMF